MTAKEMNLSAARCEAFDGIRTLERQMHDESMRLLNRSLETEDFDSGMEIFERASDYDKIREDLNKILHYLIELPF